MTKKTDGAVQTPVSRTSSGLRDALFDELDRLRNGTSNATTANATARIASGIVEIVSMEIDVQKFARTLQDKEPISGGMPPALELGN